MLKRNSMFQAIYHELVRSSNTASCISKQGLTELSDGYFTGLLCYAENVAPLTQIEADCLVCTVNAYGQYFLACHIKNLQDFALGIL